MPEIAPVCSTSNIPKQPPIVILPLLMDLEFEKRVQDLCSQILVEQDRERFQELLEELNWLLSSWDNKVQGARPDSQQET